MKMKQFFGCLMAMSVLVSPAVAQDKKEGKKKKTEEVTFVVSMFCEKCKAKIERHLSWEKGVKDLSVDLEKKTVTVQYDPAKTSEKNLKEAIEKLDYTCGIDEEID